MKKLMRYFTWEGSHLINLVWMILSQLWIWVLADQETSFTLGIKGLAAVRCGTTGSK